MALSPNKTCTYDSWSINDISLIDFNEISLVLIVHTGLKDHVVEQNHWLWFELDLAHIASVFWIDDEAKWTLNQTEWLNLIKTCHDLGLTLDGVSFHVGSGCRDATQYFNSIKGMINLDHNRKLEMNIIMEFILLLKNMKDLFVNLLFFRFISKFIIFIKLVKMPVKSLIWQLTLASNFLPLILAAGFQVWWNTCLCCPKSLEISANFCIVCIGEPSTSRNNQACVKASYLRSSHKIRWSFSNFLVIYLAERLIIDVNVILHLSTPRKNPKLTQAKQK